MSIEEKVAKLEAAMKAAEEEVLKHRENLEKANRGLEAAKERLRKLSPEQQAKTEINDTELPELLEAQALAESELENWQARYDTNKKYLDKFREKMGGSN